MIDSYKNLTVNSIVEQLKEYLKSFKKISWKESTGSTNSDLISLTRDNNSKLPCLLGARHQYNGRGRNGKIWIDDCESTLMFSCAFNLSKSTKDLSILPIIIGIATCESLQKLSNKKDIGLKWPNDIYWKNKKLSGILIEIIKNNHIVIGIGINIDNNDKLSERIDQDITSWKQIVDSPISSNDFINIIKSLALSWLRSLILLEKYELSSIIRKFHKIDVLYGRTVTIESHDSKLNGIAYGINSKGHLVVKTLNDTHVVHLGNVSVKF
ncbi:BirA family transcriptional regulator, biotin operon repressor [Candidatus Kinetoplastibacterium oncopeltii TCC290E]|uniref:biotin--[biotin carboxyl-carrier protein] ligase n=1 Tax=Candidatus Kinetoplastidibacterium stringomonadis TCC290E TaxID=1208920 RepID=M1LSZ5_9PROT|nr:biotin--[acetyl-CoA-carboxylase] ligase [Candidatus Kinetoplastibacterium oncopeltii]AGF48662.1 BirA family transcriptional regulator, biotin operon repressor [Candidatus Kinetoplastibacterium oncopeltii TCC290E]